MKKRKIFSNLSLSNQFQSITNLRENFVTILYGVYGVCIQKRTTVVSLQYHNVVQLI